MVGRQSLALPIAAVLVSLVLAGIAFADVIYVAGKDTADYQAAQSLDGTAERTLHAALTKAAEALNQPGAREVSILVAEGDCNSKLGAGTWEIPTIKNREGVLRIVGGWYNGFTARAPFEHFTFLRTSEGRNGAFLTLGQRSELAEYTISGLVFDGSPSNSYDEDTNSFLRGNSRTWPILSFGYVKTNLVRVCDNVFINAGHGVFDPAVTPASADAIVEIRNNFFVNNIKAMQVGAGINPVREVRVVGNTFLLNWPYNPDPTSSNVGGLTLHNSESARSLLIEGNIFAYNPGGAMQHDWPESRMPALTLRNNLFYKNALLFGDDEPGSGVFAGKFGPNPTYILVDLEMLEDDLGYNCEGNVVGDPGFDVDYALTTGEDGDDVSLANFAPKWDFRFVPLPSAPNAEGYGASPERVTAF